jgi:hypothetical protein
LPTRPGDDAATTRHAAAVCAIPEVVGQSGRKRIAVRAALLATEKSERQAIVESYIQNELARVLRMDLNDPGRLARSA